MSQPALPDVVYFSPRRVWTIALNTLVEVTRQKVFYFLIVFALLMITAANFFSIFTFGEEAQHITQLKFIKDTGLGAISVFGAIIAIVATAQLLPAELENRTIYTILAKPVHRSEFLLGKYLGATLLLVISVALMSTLFLAVVFLKERNLAATTYRETIEITHANIADNKDMTPQAKEQVMAQAHQKAVQVVQEIHKTAGYADIGKALLATTVKVLLIAALTLLFSTFATSLVFTVVVSAMVYFAGHLEPAAQRFYASSGTLLGKFMSGCITWLVPNLAAFDVADDLFVGTPLSWFKLFKIVSYGVFYLLVTLSLAHLIFRQREI